MPIRFRCTYCNRLLGIATRKAGTQTTCPHCGYALTVPMPADDDSRTERINLDDVEELLGRGATEVAVEPAAAPGVAATAAPPAHSAKPPVEKRPEPPKSAPKAAPPVAVSAPAAKPRPLPPPLPKPTDPDNPPLFEGDVDEILGVTAAPEEPTRAKPHATSGLDAMSLDDGPRHIVISAQKATLLMVAVVVLLALAFAAGYFLAPK